MILNDAIYALTNNRYIAGSGDGIVTVLSKPDSREVFLLDAKTLAVIQKKWSLKNGRYVFLGLQADQEYMVMVRDYKKELEPAVWDYVVAADDLTLDKLRVILQ